MTSRVGRAFVVLGLGEALARIIGFAGTIYVARTLGAESYGIISVAAAIVLYCSHLANYSVELLGAREVAKGVGDDLQNAGRIRAVVDRLVPPLLLARLGIAAACILVLGVIGLWLMPQPDGFVLAVTALGLLPVAASTRFVFIGLERPMGAAISGVLGDTLALVVVLLFVHDTTDLSVVPVSRLVGEGATALVMVALLRRMGCALPPRRSPEIVRPLFASATPLVMHAILGLAIFNSDLIFLRAMRDARTAGMYAAAYTIISFLLNLGVTYGTSILPVLTREQENGERQRATYQQAMMQVIAVAVPVAVGGTLLAGGLVELVFGDAYQEAVRPMQILMWSIVVAWVRNVVQMGLVAKDQQTFVLRTTAWSALANTLLNLALIPVFGMPGAAAATLATEALRTIVALRYAHQLALPFGVWARLWRPLVAAAAMAAVLLTIPVPHVLLAVAVGMLVYGAALFATGGLRLHNGRLDFRA
ncbi:MAG: polysaccharide biosynthesis C-terminal domain-containing protein [Gemmatimonadaceae bacterium]|jgi:O-antigen/teichoic acid export membrane protein|nr:polysaccharide biosynthesis C-terminal domain-containing protein [Gemmatimonadaceae bacterium]MCC6429473.1 polysaccharide biosynthesis C-terminal domain-containing protein [Gemmatimonadaceae bacterium]